MSLPICQLVWILFTKGIPSQYNKRKVVEDARSRSMDKCKQTGYHGDGSCLLGNKKQTRFRTSATIGFGHWYQGGRLDALTSGKWLSQSSPIRSASALWYWLDGKSKDRKCLFTKSSREDKMKRQINGRSCPLATVYQWDLFKDTWIFSFHLADS